MLPRAGKGAGEVLGCTVCSLVARVVMHAEALSELNTGGAFLFFSCLNQRPSGRAFRAGIACLEPAVNWDPLSACLCGRSGKFPCKQHNACTVDLEERMRWGLSLQVLVLNALVGA